MVDIVHIQTIQSNTYLTQIKAQFERMDKSVESGHTVTLVLSENNRAISLSITRDNVAKSDVPSEGATAKTYSLADNESLSALITNSYHFDIGDINRQIKAHDIEAEINKATHQDTKQSKRNAASLPPGLPNPSVHFIAGNWVLAEDCVYTTNDLFTLTAKSGFQTDLASIPRILWVLIASFELSLAAPIFHDLIYRSMGEVALPDGVVLPAGKTFTRSEADDIFLELMTRAKIPFWKRNVAYLAVDFFGVSSWRKPSIG